METIKDLGTYTLTALLENSIAKFAERPALAFVGEEPMTYAEVGRRISLFRDLLVSTGVEPGSRVVIFGPSSPNWGIAYFSVVSLGAIAVPLLPDFSAKETDACVRHSGATTLIIATKLAEKIPDPASLGLSRIFRLDDFELLVGDVVREARDTARAAREEDTASIIYTSGTTGRSKGVELTHKNLAFTAMGGQFFQRINKFDVGLSILPMSHVYEFTIGFLLFFLNGACVYYLDKPPAVTTLLPALAKVRPTIMLSVPIIMEKIYKNKIVPTFTSKPLVARLYAIPFFRVLFHRLAGKSLKRTFGGRIKFFGIGGAKVDPVVERFLKEARFPYAIGYGLTETSPLLAGSGPAITKPGTIGPVMPGVELKILDPDSASGIGEVVARGPNVMKGYYKDPELTATVIDADGWFRTGDLGAMDAHGRLGLKGRSKNMILGASGENIYPEDIEFVLNQHPFVSESLVVEGEHSSLVAIVQIDEEKYAKEARLRAEREATQSARPDMGQQLHAMGEAVGDAMNGAMNEMGHMLQYKREEIMNEIKFFVNENVNRISRIDRVELIDTFEKTASQKIKRYLYSIQKSLSGGTRGKA